MDQEIDGTPFSVLMDRAVKLKKAQTAHQSEKYDSFPSFYANSIWPNEEAIGARKLGAFSERLAAAELIKEEGNAAFRDGRPGDAMTKYETALSVFRFLENTNPRWKSEGIQDRFVKEVERECDDDRERRELDRFLANCYNNVALASYKMGDFSLAAKACDHALAVDRKNAKALLVRARALLAPKNSTLDDQASARSNLQMAVKNNPGNREARRLLERLNDRTKAQRAKDKRTFEGLFDRGEIYHPRELRERKEARRKRAEGDAIDSRRRDVILGRQLARMYEERGLEKEKETLERSLARARGTRELDFRNPSAKMIEDAKGMGVDLNDARTVELLENMKGERDGRSAAAATKALATDGGVESSGGHGANALASSDGVRRGGRGARETWIAVLSSGIVIAGYAFLFYKQFRMDSS